MSNWITDNKPAAMVAGVGLLLFLGLSATGYIVNSKRSELDKKISIAAKEIKSANAAEITPSRSSNEELEKELNRYAKAVGSLETAYKPFLASSALVPTTPTAFQNELKTFRDSLISSCKKKNILITDTSSWLGFQVYSTQAPSVQAASTLGFELKAVNSLANKLTASARAYRRALELYRKTDFPRGEGDALGNLGGVSLLLGRFREGLRVAIDADQPPVGRGFSEDPLRMAAAPDLAAFLRQRAAATGSGTAAPARPA